MKVLIDYSIKFDKYKVAVTKNEIDCSVKFEIISNKTYTKDKLFETMIKPREIDTLEVFKDVLSLGQFIDNNCNSQEFKYRIDDLFQFSKGGEFIVEEAFINNRIAFKKLIRTIHEKYGNILPQIAVKDMHNEYVVYIERYDITTLLVESHRIYQLFVLINCLSHKKKISLKHIDFEKASDDDIKLSIAMTLDTSGCYKIFTQYNETTKTFINSPIYCSLTDISYFELRRLISDLNNDYPGSLMCFCKNCNNYMIKEHKKQIYCGEDSCNLDRNRKRRKKCDDKKRGDKNNGNN